jgi:acetyl esterase/lipase
MPTNLFGIAIFNLMMKITNLFVKLPKNVIIQSIRVPTRNQRHISLSMYSPLDYDGSLPCVVYDPGGGLVVSTHSVLSPSLAVQSVT